MASKNKPERSDVWRHFIKVPDNPNKARCKYCIRDISRGGKNASLKGYTTTNMWAHVKRFHESETNKSESISSEQMNSEPGTSLQKNKQATIPLLLSRAKKYDVSDPRAREITQLIAEEICVDMEPLDHVNKIGFQRLIKKLCPQYEMVSRTHITQTIIPDMYTRAKTKVKSVLENISYLCVTSDLWTSDASSNINDFISITAHGLDKNFVPHNFCLEVMPFEGDAHTGGNIADNLLKALTEWGIMDKVKVIITDNARNMLTAMAKFPQIDHASCMAHSLQLVLEGAIFTDDDIKETIIIARKIVGHFSHSTKALKILKEAQKNYNLPEHVLIQDVPTRWDSTYAMLDRLNEQRIAIQAVLPKLKCPYDLSTRQWILVEQVVKLLSYFNDITKALSKDQVTLADAIPLINSLFKMLNKESLDKEKDSLKIIVDHLKHHLTQRFNDLEENENYILATILDPRYKARVFRHNLTIDNAKKLLLSTSALEKDPIEEVPEIVLKPPVTEASTRDGIWDICQEIINDVEMEEPLSIFSVTGFKEEIERYLKAPNLDHSADAFKYWSENSLYPNLKKLAQKYLSFKPSSVQSERLFSTAGNIQTPKRNRLGSENLKMLCFLNKNLISLKFQY